MTTTYLFVCEHCRNTTRAKIAGNHKDDALDVVKREILRRTRTEEYKKAD